MFDKNIIVPTVHLKQVTLPDYRYYELNGIKYPSVTTVLQYFHKDDIDYKRALDHYENMVRQNGISPDARLNYTAVRGTLGHYILTSLLAKKNSLRKPEFEVDKKVIKKYNLKSKEIGNNWSRLRRDMKTMVYIIGKLLLENDIYPVGNGLEFMTLSLEYSYAGTCDILAYYRRKLSVIDIKTAWLKKESGDFSLSRVEKYEAQTSAYKNAIIEMSNSEIVPKDMYIFSLCPDNFFPDKRRVINPNKKYYIYKCRDRFDEFIECRKDFRKEMGF